MSIPPMTTVLPYPAGRVIPAASSALDIRRIRDDFPILRQKIHGKPLVYLDNAATTQKPNAVLDAIRKYYTADNANIHRAVHQLSERATRDYEAGRLTVQRFLGAAHSREIVFVRGATEGVNLVAASWGRTFLRPGDEIIVSTMEHHSNIVPWQLACEASGARLRVIPINDRGELLLDEYEKLLNDRTRLVAVTHLSNALGTINPVSRIIESAHARGAKVLLDAAQSASHLTIDVQELDCDFLVCSGHKLYGPTGIGVLYGKAELLEAMPPWQGGGDMIHTVSFNRTTYADLPNKFEAGTPDIAGVVGLAAALDYLSSVGIDRAAAHEDMLLAHATRRFEQIAGVRLVGTAEQKAAVLSFVVAEPVMSALDVGTKLDLEGIAVRTGHHCCQPLMDRFGLPGTARASFALYNTLAEVDALADSLTEIVHQATRRTRSLPVEATKEPCPAEMQLCGGTQATCPPHLEIEYAPAVAASPRAAGEELAEVFEFFDDWNDRYQYLIEMGDKLPKMPDAMKTECTRVHGCQSTVYLTARQKPGTADVLEFLADSDADLVRGLIGLLEHLYSGQKAADILAFDIEGYFAKLGLDQHLSMNRRNGLEAMLKRVRQHATDLVA